MTPRENFPCPKGKKYFSSLQLDGRQIQSLPEGYNNNNDMMVLVFFIFISMGIVAIAAHRFECTWSDEGVPTCNNVGDNYTFHVDIRGVERVALLQALWENQEETLFPANIYRASTFNMEQAVSMLQTQPLTIFGGRSIHMDLRDNVVSSAIYDATSRRPAADIVMDLRCAARRKRIH